MAESEEDSGTFNSTEGISAYFVFFSTLLAVVLVLCKLLHDRPRLANLFPEAGLILVVGIAAGSFVHLFVNEEPRPPMQDDDQSAGYSTVAKSLLSFSPEVFFIALLPPIIFNSGYHLRRELFFRHIAPIVLFAVLGTLVSAISVSFILKLVVALGLTEGFQPRLSELLAFGALISATDTVSTLSVFQAKRVDPHLFYLVFGESVLNDAVGLILFKVFADFVEPHNGAVKIVASTGKFIISFCWNAIASPILGVLSGVAAAFLFKHVDMRSQKMLELSLYVLIMYVPFLLAELIHLSGIVTILFTGMAARSFVVPNLSVVTAGTAESLFRLASYLAETSIFLELGLSMFGLLSRNYLQWRFLLWSLLACLVARALSVYPISWFYNAHLRNQHHKQSVDDEYPQTPSTSESGAVDPSQALAGSEYHYASQGFVLRRNSDDQSSITPRTKRDLKISTKVSHMLWFSGLRGAMSYACSRSFPDSFGHREDFTIATVWIVLFTVFVLGGTTEMALKCLKVEVNVDEAVYMEKWHLQRQQDGLILGFEKFVNRLAVRDDVQPDDERVGAEGKVKLAYESGMNRTVSSISSSEDYQQQVEVTASRHFESLEAVGSARDNISAATKGSIFDFGGEHR
jgi:NhaP-type Na+/H+ or K+/H+ antiporter